MNEAALYQAHRDAQGTDREEQAYAELRAALHVNEPPAGWTPEEDRREELLAESEHLAMRRTAS
jgi:hypothetical protein